LTKARNSKRILITGGSGFIGTTLVSQATQAGFSVVNIDIRKPRLLDHEEYWQSCDIRDFKSLEKIIFCERPDYLINLAADLGMQDAPLDFFNTNTVGVENLVEIVNKASFIKRSLYASSLLVCRNGYIPSSFDDYCPPNVYGQSKVLGEKIIKDRSSSKNWIIVRPTSVWGPWFAHSYLKFFKAVELGLYLQPGSGELIKPICFVGNASFMILKLLVASQNDVLGRYFYLADYPERTTKEWSDAIRREVGRKGSAPSLPVCLFKIPALLGDLAQILGINDPIFSSFRLKNMLTGAKYPVDDIKRIAGELPFDLDAGVKTTVNWIRNYEGAR
jgi:nucleoside-diphosphate-sugar epimerase